jgi:ATP adenylyltransferase
MWAPWRMPWIRESCGGVTDCFICDMIEADESGDRENLLLHRGEKTIILMNRYPYSNGHLMIAPIRHVSDPRELVPEEWAEIGLFTQISLESLEKSMNIHGANIGWNIGQISGAGLEQHIHQHIVPRWSGDTNFMPVIGQTKVISQDLWESYDEITKILKLFKQ